MTQWAYFLGQSCEKKRSSGHSISCRDLDGLGSQLETTSAQLERFNLCFPCHSLVACLIQSTCQMTGGHATRCPSCCSFSVSTSVLCLPMRRAPSLSEMFTGEHSDLSSAGDQGCCCVLWQQGASCVKRKATSLEKILKYMTECAQFVSTTPGIYNICSASDFWGNHIFLCACLLLLLTFPRTLASTVS